MPTITEIESPSLPGRMKQFYKDERFVWWIEGQSVSEAMPFSDAMREASFTRSADARVGFLEDEPAPVVPDIVPSYISRKKRK